MSNSTVQISTPKTVTLIINSLRKIKRKDGSGNTFRLNNRHWINDGIVNQLLKGAGFAETTPHMMLIGNKISWEEYTVKGASEATPAFIEGIEFKVDGVKRLNYDLTLNSTLREKVQDKLLNEFASFDVDFDEDEF